MVIVRMSNVREDNSLVGTPSFNTEPINSNHIPMINSTDSSEKTQSKAPSVKWEGNGSSPRLVRAKSTGDVHHINKSNENHKYSFNDLTKNLRHKKRWRLSRTHSFPYGGKRLGKEVTHKFVDIKKLYDWYRSEYDNMYIGLGAHTVTKPADNYAREVLDSKNPNSPSKSSKQAKDMEVVIIHGTPPSKDPPHLPPASSRENLIEPENKPRVTAAHAFFVAVKAFVGTGILFLPRGFYNGGIVFSSILLIIVAYFTLHCMILLTETTRIYKGHSFGEIGGVLYGNKMKNLVFISICLSQMGFCCAYYIFVGQNMRDFILLLTNCKVEVESWITTFGQLIFTVPLCLVRNVSGFSGTSVIGDIIILTSILYICSYCVSKLKNDGIPEIKLFNTGKFTLFIGAAMFSFEGIALVTPLADSIGDTKKLEKIFNLCIIFVLSIFLLMGCLGYLAFGEKLETNIVLNLPNDVPSKILRVVYSIAIILSFPLLLHPCTAIIEKVIFKNKRRTRTVILQETIFRTLEVTFLAVVAYFGNDHLENVVGLIGCFACIPIAFIYPALFHTKIAKSSIIALKDWSVAIAGIILMLITTYLTISNIIYGEADIPRSICYKSNKL